MDIRIRCNNIVEELSGHKKLKNGKPRLGEFTLTYINLDTPNLAYINFFVLGTSKGGTSEKKHPVSLALRLCEFISTAL